jgi:hypothetical protein
MPNCVVCAILRRELDVCAGPVGTDCALWPLLSKKTHYCKPVAIAGTSLLAVLFEET